MKVLVKFWNNNLQKCFWDFLHFERLCSWSSSKPNKQIFNWFWNTEHLCKKFVFSLTSFLGQFVLYSLSIFMFDCQTYIMDPFCRTFWPSRAKLFQTIFSVPPSGSFSLSLYIWFFFFSIFSNPIEIELFYANKTTYNKGVTSFNVCYGHILSIDLIKCRTVLYIKSIPQ